MGLDGSMRTAISGMNAQSSRLSAVADNIANSGTNGYKKASVEFSSLVVPNAGTSYASGALGGSVRYSIGSEGTISYTTSATDLAIRGNGFFVVSDNGGSPALTRAGSFVPDSEGHLINVAGFRLMGYELVSGFPTGGSNSFDELVPIQLPQSGMTTQASTFGRLSLNLPYDAPELSSALYNLLPSENSIYSNSARRMSFSHGDPASGVVGDVYFAKLDENTWEVTAFLRDPAEAPLFPYALPYPEASASTVLTLDPATGDIVDGNPMLELLTSDGDAFSINVSGVTQTSTSPVSGGMQPQMNLATNHPVFDTSGGDMLPSDNDPASAYQFKQSMTGYTSDGTWVILDVYYVKTDTDTWEVSIFNALTATGGGFPYGAAGDPPLATSTLTFDLASGALISGSPLDVPFGTGSYEIDYSAMVALDEADPAWSGKFGTVAIDLNLDPAASVVRPYLLGWTPATNQSNTQFTGKSSLRAYGHVGNLTMLDVYFTKGPDNIWEVTVFDQADASPDGFPYGNEPLTTILIEFDPATGNLIEDANLTIPIPNGENLTVDLSAMRQLSGEFALLENTVNGSSAASMSGYSISDDGVVYIQYDNGQSVPHYQLALATTQSPDLLDVFSGNVFKPGMDSGSLLIGTAGAAGYGVVVSGALEGSNVDIAEELTSMIESQRNYSANSKVFQTGSDLMDVLVNLKR